MERFDEGLPNPIIIKSSKDFDKLGIKDMHNIPYTVEGLLQMDLQDRQDLLWVLSGIVGLAYQEEFLQKVLSVYTATR